MISWFKKKKVQEFVPQEPVLSFYRTFLENPRRFRLAVKAIPGRTFYCITDLKTQSKMTMSLCADFDGHNELSGCGNIKWMNKEDCDWIFTKLKEYYDNRALLLKRVHQKRLMRRYGKRGNNYVSKT